MCFMHHKAIDVQCVLWIIKKFNSASLCCFRKAINKGIGVDNMHYLNDGLWKVW